MPKDLSRVFFSDNGSTAVEIAMKVAIQYWYNKGEKKNLYPWLVATTVTHLVQCLLVLVQVFTNPFKDFLIIN